MVPLAKPFSRLAWWTSVAVLAACQAASPGVGDGDAPGLPEAHAAQPTPHRAVVNVDTMRIMHPVNPLVFGMHLEWIADGEGILEPHRAVIKSEVLDALRTIRAPLFRFPGGILADYYDWRHGIGDPAARAPSVNPFTSRREPHRFGTPEFVDLLKATSARAMMTANYGTGDSTQAGAWAAHLSRAGADAAFWEVGNEIYLSGPKTKGPNGKAIYRAPETYARDFPSYRDAIRRAFPDAKVGAIAHIDNGAFPLAPAENREWTERMLGALRSPVDFISVHSGYAPVAIDDSLRLTDSNSRLDAYQSMYAAADQLRENLREVRTAIQRLSPDNANVQLALTEFGPLFGISGRQDITAQYVDQSRTLAAALYVASVLDVLLQDPGVMAACYTNPVHPWYGGLLTTTPAGFVKTPTYYIYLMYQTRFEGHLVNTTVVAPTFRTSTIGIVKARSAVSTLIATAAVSEDRRRVAIMLVNRDTHQPIATTIALDSFVPASVDCQILSASSPSARNGPGLTATTHAASSGDIAPAPFVCAPSSTIDVSIPANSVLSLVARQ
jgi:alpha-L-arabinofuranosidase